MSCYFVLNLLIYIQVIIQTLYKVFSMRLSLVTRISFWLILPTACLVGMAAKIKEDNSREHPEEPDMHPKFKCTSSTQCEQGKYCSSRSHNCEPCFNCSAFGRRPATGPCDGTPDSCGSCIQEGQVYGFCDYREKVNATGFFRDATNTPHWLIALIAGAFVLLIVKVVITGRRHKRFEGAIIQIFTSSENVPEFPVDQNNSPTWNPANSVEIPNITIYNGTDYLLRVYDDVFKKLIHITAKDRKTLGWNPVGLGLTKVVIQAYDNQNCLMKAVAFRTWKGYSWIVMDHVIVRQRYGDVDYTMRDPGGSQVEWALDLQKYGGHPHWE